MFPLFFKACFHYLEFIYKDALSKLTVASDIDQTGGVFLLYL